ncbi:hypothetical protein NE237_018538 [Protea cynaroides]|uniref:Uncharacterized protein n=1 Tax=Protea cynaroides TaxID=273540 RepID=A0A9Q0QPA0_9MAGN|nr:hypothetical protein NE237_018538 [Protea cynaroides]
MVSQFLGRLIFQTYNTVNLMHRFGCKILSLMVGSGLLGWEIVSDKLGTGKLIVRVDAGGGSGFGNPTNEGDDRAFEMECYLHGEILNLTSRGDNPWEAAAPFGPGKWPVVPANDHSNGIFTGANGFLKSTPSLLNLQASISPSDH